MVLEKLSTSLKNALNKLTSGKVDKAAVEELTEEIEKSLISADVSINLSKEISEKIQKRALKEKVAGGLTAKAVSYTHLTLPTIYSV